MSGRRLSFPPDGRLLREVRAKVRSLAGELGIDGQVGDNLALVVDELVNNAIEHGAPYRRDARNLVVQIETSQTRVAIAFHDPEMPDDEVDDLAASLDDANSGMPSLDSERGRGLFLLTVYLEGLRAERASDGGLRLIGFIDRQ